MKSVEINVDSTKTSGQLYLDIDGITHLVPNTQEDAELGNLFIVPEFTDEQDINITPMFPSYTNNEDVYIYWYTFNYLMTGKVAPTKVERIYLNHASN
jgi:hypothetical protein